MVARVPHGDSRRRRLGSIVQAIFLACCFIGLAGGASLNYHVYDSLQFMVTYPPVLVSNITYTPALYGDALLNPVGANGLQMEIVLAYPDPTACSDLRDSSGVARTSDGRSYEGLAMLILRGDCTFGRKSLFAQLAGAALVIHYSCSPEAPSLCKPERTEMFSGSEPVTVTTMMIDYWDGHRLATVLEESCAANCSVLAWFKGSSPIHPSDRAALTVISQDMILTNLADTRSQTGLLPSFATIGNVTWDPCVNRVAGVWCEGDRIVILNLEAMNVTGIMSPAVGELTALHQLILANNGFFCQQMPCSYGLLSELRVLSLFSMNLISLGPRNTTCLDTLNHLMFIDASFNLIPDLSGSMRTWKALKSIDISNNVVDMELNTDVFKLFVNLEYLSLRHNMISINVTGRFFSLMSQLQYLYVSSNLIYGELDERAFDNMPNLLEIDMSLNMLEGRLPIFDGTNNVVHIDLSNNRLEGNCSLWEMGTLTYLALGSNIISERMDNLPRNLPALLFLDLSNNFVSMPPEFTDVGAFLFNLMPIGLQTVHLENNLISGTWGVGFLQTYPQLAHVFLAHNFIRQLPGDIFFIGELQLVDLDVSYNKLQGALPAVGPPPPTTSLKLDGNPNLRGANLELPVWLQIDMTGSFYLPTSVSSYVCPSLVGSSFHLTVLLDPSYFGYQGCECNRGYYGSPPNCIDIPSSTVQGVSAKGVGEFTDALFGDKRFFQGVDTFFLLGSHNTSSKASVHTVQRAGDDGHRIHLTSQALGASLIVRAIYITFQINPEDFSGQDDSLAVYSGGLDLRGERVTFWQGTDTVFPGNIALGNMFPPSTVTVLAQTAVVNFRSRHAEGTHFNASFTLSSDCPPNYHISYDDRSQPNGYCALPQASSASTTIILLLVMSVIIGVLALCLLGQKMSTIQNLINGDPTCATRGGSKSEQAQEIYGPVLSVEESWRRQLKRDYVKEMLMLALEVFGYLSAWLVILQQIHVHVGSILSDKFLVGYSTVVTLSTVTGLISVVTRVRVIREIHRELHNGLAVVPTIENILHIMKTKSTATASEKSQATPREHRRERGSGSFSRRRHAADEALAEDPTFGARSKASGLQAFGRPLLGESHNDSESSSLAVPSSLSSAATNQFEASTDSQSSWFGFLRPRTASSNGSSGKDTPTNEGKLKVKLSSKDPNVQLAWVQRQISTTRLTSFNLIFSTIPFLVLNQVRLFTNDSICTDWPLQLSSLFASMLLGVKLLRVLALGELLQRRNELVFEVIVAGSGLGSSAKPATRDREREREREARDPTGTHTPAARGFSLHQVRSHTSVAGLDGPLASPPQMASSLQSTMSTGSGSSEFLQSPLRDEFLSSGESVDPQACLLAPVTSLVSEDAGAVYLFAPSSSFNASSHLGHLPLDEASLWARSNQGSALQLQMQPLVSSEVSSSATSDLANRFGLGFGTRTVADGAPPGGGTNESSRTHSSANAVDSAGDSWIQSHMLADEPPLAASTSATRMKRLHA